MHAYVRVLGRRRRFFLQCKKTCLHTQDYRMSHVFWLVAMLGWEMLRLLETQSVTCCWDPLCLLRQLWFEILLCTVSKKCKPRREKEKEGLKGMQERTNNSMGEEWELALKRRGAVARLQLAGNCISPEDFFRFMGISINVILIWINLIFRHPNLCHHFFLFYLFYPQISLANFWYQ